MIKTVVIITLDIMWFCRPEMTPNLIGAASNAALASLLSLLASPRACSRSRPVCNSAGCCHGGIPPWQVGAGGWGARRHACGDTYTRSCLIVFHVGISLAGNTMELLVGVGPGSRLWIRPRHRSSHSCPSPMVTYVRSLEGGSFWIGYYCHSARLVTERRQCG